MNIFKTYARLISSVEIGLVNAVCGKDKMLIFFG